MYSLHGHGQMIRDKRRVRAYARAIHAAVKPGDVVVDLGAGTGLFSILACQAGAKRVHAIEPSDAIEVAREMAAANGFADRIEFIRASSREVTLPRRADLLVADLRGVTPHFRTHLPDFDDVRRRLLKRGGIHIPARDTVWGAVVAAPIGADLAGKIDFNPMRRRLSGIPHKHCFGKESLLSRRCRLSEVDYGAIASADFTATVRFGVARYGGGGGLAVWFDAKLFRGVGFSSAPGPVPMIYGQLFLPWEWTVPLHPGDWVESSVSARQSAGDYVWEWSAVIRRGHRQIAAFNQNNLQSIVGSPVRLRRRAPDFVPGLNESMEMERFILETVDGRKTIAEIAAAVMERFPDRIASRDEAIKRVGDLLERFPTTDEQ